MCWKLSGQIEFCQPESGIHSFDMILLGKLHERAKPTEYWKCGIVPPSVDDEAASSSSKEEEPSTQILRPPFFFLDICKWKYLKTRTWPLYCYIEDASKIILNYDDHQFFSVDFQGYSDSKIIINSKLFILFSRDIQQWYNFQLQTNSIETRINSTKCNGLFLGNIWKRFRK